MDRYLTVTTVFDLPVASRPTRDVTSFMPVKYAGLPVQLAYVVAKIADTAGHPRARAPRRIQSCGTSIRHLRVLTASAGSFRALPVRTTRTPGERP